MKDKSPLLDDATSNDGDKHNAGNHDGGILKGNDGNNGLDDGGIKGKAVVAASKETTATTAWM
jgi:hypothetical protein